MSSIIDWSVDPCQDFWNFACGSWIKNTQLPPTKPALTRSFSVILASNQGVLQKILEGNVDAKLSAFYSSCLNAAGMDAQGFTPVKPLLSMIASISDMCVCRS